MFWPRSAARQPRHHFQLSSVGGVRQRPLQYSPRTCGDHNPNDRNLSDHNPLNHNQETLA